MLNREYNTSKVFTKINAVTNLSDARYCAGMGVAFLGFCLDKSDPSYISPEQFKKITGWIQGVALVGELEEKNKVSIQQISQQYMVDYIQLSHPLALASVMAQKKPVIIKFSLQGDES